MNTRSRALSVHLLCAFSLLPALLASPALAQPPPDAIPVEVTGVLTVLHADDFERGKSWQTYSLEAQGDQRRFNLHFEGKIPPGLQSGATIRIRGHARGRELYLAADGPNANPETLAPAVTVVSGDQKTLVLVANFTDAAVSCANSAIQDLMFTDPAGQSVDDLYREMSLNQVSISGAVVGPFPINVASTSACNIGAWADATDAAAQAANIDLTAYVRKIYVMPSNNSCGYTGVGQVGGSPTRAWIFRCASADTYGHELGHNLGMGHAATLTNEYGDTSDIMGAGGFGLRQVNAPHREQMGWMPPEQIGAITQGGLYELAPIEVDPTMAAAPQILKLAKPDTGDHYFLSYRQWLGFDTSLTSGLVRGVAVHRYAADGSAKKTYLLATLADGGSFSDGVNGITITQHGHASDRASFEVTMSTACAQGAPGVSLSPAGQSGVPGTTLTYTATLTNMDSATCPSTTFNLTNSLPVGWLGAVSPASVTLLPGQAAGATFTVTSSATASLASYGLSLSATDASIANHTGSASASYTVTAPCIANAPALGLLPASQSGQAGSTLRYAVSLANRDGSTCAVSTFNLFHSLPSGWSGSVSPGTFTLAPGQTGSATLTVTSPAGVGSGTYAVGVATNDAATSAHGASASGNYTIAGDSQEPTAPTTLTATLKRKQIALAWKAATDNIGVTGYKIWRNGAVLGSSANLSYTDSKLTRGVTYVYYVTAYDAAGNLSPASNSVTVSY